MGNHIMKTTIEIADDLAARRVNALGGWDTQVTVTTADDIGALTAAILRAEPRLANLLRSGASESPARVDFVRSVIELDSGEERGGRPLAMNDIGRVELVLDRHQLGDVAGRAGVDHVAAGEVLVIYA